jgi:hypothetical protein
MRSRVFSAHLKEDEGNRSRFGTDGTEDKQKVAFLTNQETGPNSSQAAVVKRADACIAGAGWPSDNM